MIVDEETPTFGSRLRRRRVAKGWSQHYLASQAGCTNSNISYLENHPSQRPKIETVEALAAALGWPVNEARRLAGYPESDLNISRIETEDDFRFALYGYKQLSEHGRELVKKQIGMIIDFILEYEQGACETDLDITFDEQFAENVTDHEVPEMTLDELGRRIGDREKKNRGKG